MFCMQCIKAALAIHPDQLLLFLSSQKDIKKWVKYPLIQDARNKIFWCKGASNMKKESLQVRFDSIKHII
jgi:hypothetical protein